MSIFRSKETENLCAQCDTCFDVVDFDEDTDFDDARFATYRDGWKSKRYGGKWTNVCCDCLALTK